MQAELEKIPCTEVSGVSSSEPVLSGGRKNQKRLHLSICTDRCRYSRKRPIFFQILTSSKNGKKQSRDFVIDHSAAILRAANLPARLAADLVSTASRIKQKSAAVALLTPTNLDQMAGPSQQVGQQAIQLDMPVSAL